MHPKLIKMDTWTSRCLLGVPVNPWITTTVPQATKMEPRGLQNHNFGYKKRPISAVNQSAVACLQMLSKIIKSVPKRTKSHQSCL